MDKVGNHTFWYLLSIEGCLFLEYFITSSFSVIETIFGVSGSLAVFWMAEIFVIQNLKLSIIKKSNIIFFIYLRIFLIIYFTFAALVAMIVESGLFYEDFICHEIHLKSILVIVAILLIIVAILLTFLNFINCMLWMNYKIWYWATQTGLDYKRYTLKFWIYKIWTLLKNLCKIVRIKISGK